MDYYQTCAVPKPVHKKSSKKPLTYRQRKANFQAVRYAHVFCQTCGSTKDLEIHHKVKKSQGGTDNIDNLILLCRECHKKAHGINV